MNSSAAKNCIIKTCLPTINSISTMIRHDIVGVRKEKVILIAPGFGGDPVASLSEDITLLDFFEMRRLQADMIVPPQRSCWQET